MIKEFFYAFSVGKTIKEEHLKNVLYTRKCIIYIDAVRLCLIAKRRISRIRCLAGKKNACGGRKRRI